MQKTVFQGSLAHINTFGQNKRALELPRSDPAVQKYPISSVINLPPTHHQLLIFNCDRQISFAKTCNRKRYTVGAI